MEQVVVTAAAPIFTVLIHDPTRCTPQSWGEMPAVPYQPGDEVEVEGWAVPLRVTRRTWSDPTTVVLHLARPTH